MLTVSTVADNTIPDASLTLREALALVNAAGDPSAGLGRGLTAAEAAQVSGAFGSGDTIGFMSEFGGPIALQQGQFVITRAVSITGPEAGLTIDAGSRDPFMDASRIFSVDDGTAAAIIVTFSGLTLTGGVATEGGAIVNAEDLSLTGCTLAGNAAVLSGGGGIANFGKVTLTDCTLSDNSAGGDGGGIANVGTAILIGCTLADNSATAFNSFGGGIFNEGIATLTLTNCALSGNSAGLDGGGIDNLGTATLGNCTFVVNSAHRDGGGIVNAGTATLTATDCTFGTNSADTSGGGIVNAGTATLTNCTFQGNLAIVTPPLVDDSFGPPFGGGIVNAGTAALTNCTLLGNLASMGGGLYNLGTATLAGCTVSGNSAVSINDLGGSGGGLYNPGTATLTRCNLGGNSALYGGGIDNEGAATLTDCTLAGNSATWWGGGVNNGFYKVATATLTLTGCTLSGNSTGIESGGGIENEGTATLTDCTLSGNSAGGKGGGIASYVDFGDETLTLTGCTLSGNSALNGGGGLFNEGRATLNNTIVANSSVGGDVFNNISFRTGVNTLAGSHNLIETPITGMGTNSLTDTVSGDPLLGPLQDNGGPTLTHALLPGSPAINQGSNALAVGPDGNPLTADQRGAPFVRIADGTVDLGAYEAQPLSLMVDIPIDEADGNRDPGDLSLREAIALANANPGDNTITFSPTVFAAHQTITLALGALAISDSLSIIGPDAGLTLDAGNASRIFTVDNGTDAAVTVAINGLSLTRGRADHGGAIANAEDLRLNGCTIADSFGAAGGAIENEGTVTLADCTLEGNSAVEGGGIKNLGTATLTNCTLEDNSANEAGGIANFGTATLTGCTLARNSISTFFGGGGGITNHGTAIFIGCTLVGNAVSSVNGDGVGGGIKNLGTATFADCDLVRNAAARGGAIENEGTVTLTDCTLEGNSADLGGGIKNLGTATLTDCTLAHNGAAFGGGGVRNDGTATFAITNSTLADNRVFSFRGGDGGGGIENFGAAALTGCTLARNSANEGGGIANFGAATLINSIVANSPEGGDVSNSNTLRGSNNLIQAPVTGSGTNMLSDTLTGDPLLGPLTDNGGRTLTQALLPGSPAIDAASSGDAPALDQRGVARVGAPDIGAFESRKFTASIQGGGTQSAHVGTAFPSQLVVQVASAFGEPVAGGQLTLSPPVTGASATLSGNPITIDSAGAASLVATANGTAGSYAMWVTANGLTNAVSFSLTNTVGTATVVTTSPTITFRQSAQTVTLMAAVASPQGTPNGGTVTFSIAGAGADVTADVTNGVAIATFTVNGGLPPGSYAVSAHYSGTAEFEASASSGPGDGTLTVKAAATTTAVTSNPTVIFSRNTQTVTITAQVRSAAGAIDAGSVTFSVAGGGPDVTTSVDASGRATATFTLNGDTPPGSYAIVATYNGTRGFAGSAGAGTLTVLSFSQATNDLVAQVDTADLARGIRNSLDSILYAAVSSFNRDNTTAGANQLEAFQNHVRAQRGKSINVALADALLAYAEKLLSAIGSPR